MPYFDTHFHPDLKADPALILRNSQMAGVEYMMVVGGDAEKSSFARDFTRYAADRCWFSVGIHPHDAESWDDDLGELSEYCDDEAFAAVGEVGLDYFYESSERKRQCEVFEQFIDFATKLDRPLIVHCRDRDGRDDAYSDCYERVKDFSRAGGKLILHCYTGTISWAEKFLELGAFFGITGIVTFPKGENVREIVRMLPRERLLLETDSPYLAPVPHRGRTNCPAYLPLIGEAVSSLLNVSIDELAELSTDNAFRVFGLPRNRFGGGSS